MKFLLLSKGYSTAVDDYRYEELEKFKWSALVCKNRKKEISIVYAVRMTSTKAGPSRMIYMHRQIKNVTDPFIQVDHRDHNGLNNIEDNLRICEEITQNRGNSRLRIDNTSGVKGVTWNIKLRKWQAQISYKGKHIIIGNFDVIEDAAAAYEEKAKELFGEFYCIERITTKMKVMEDVKND